MILCIFMNLLKSLGVEEDGRNIEVDRFALSRPGGMKFSSYQKPLNQRAVPEVSHL